MQLYAIWCFFGCVSLYGVHSARPITAWAPEHSDAKVIYLFIGPSHSIRAYDRPAYVTNPPRY